VSDSVNRIAYLSLHFNIYFFTWTWVSWYQNVSILDSVGDEDNDEDNVVTAGIIKTCKAAIKPSPANQHPAFYLPDALLSPITQPTMLEH